MKKTKLKCLRGAFILWYSLFSFFPPTLLADIIDGITTDGTVTSTMSADGTIQTIAGTGNFSSAAYDVAAGFTVINQCLGGGCTWNVTEQASTWGGALQWSGDWIFTNHFGITIQDTATIDVNGSLALSTLDLVSQVNNQFIFETPAGQDPADILNEGAINVHEGGSLALLSQSIENRGVINARMAQVVFGAGEKMTVSFDPNGLISLVVDEGLKQTMTDAQGHQMAAIQNLGTIEANGGLIELSAKSLGPTLDLLINNAGIIEAQEAVVTKDGQVEFVEGRVEMRSNGAIENSGFIRANTLDEKGYTFRNTEGGTLDGSDLKADVFLDNLDGAANISGNVGSNISDTGDINVVGNVNVTANNRVWRADSDNTGGGNFSQNTGTVIVANNRNLTIRSGSDATHGTGNVNLRSLTGANNLEVTAAGGHYTQAAGGIVSANNVVISAGGNVSIASNVRALLNDMTITADSDNNGVGALSFANAVELQAGGASNDDITLRGANSFLLTPGSYVSTDGGVASAWLRSYDNLTLGAKGSSGDVTVGGAFDYNHVADGNLTLEADNDIHLNQGVRLTRGNLTLTADKNLDGAGGIHTAAGESITTITSGNVTMKASDDSTIGAMFLANNAQLTLQAGVGPVTYASTADLAMANNRLNVGVNTTLDLNGNDLSLRTESNDGTIRLRGDETVSINTKDTNSGTWDYYGSGAYASLAGGGQYYHLRFSGTGTWDAAVDTRVFNALDIGAGAAFDLNGRNLNMAGAVFSNDGTLRLQGGETLNSFTNDTDSGTIEYDGSGTYTSLKAGNAYNHLKISGTGSFTANAALDVNGSFTQSAGTFNANAAMDIDGSYQQSGGAFNAPVTTLTIGDDFTKTGGVFNHRNGKIIFDTVSTAAIDIDGAIDFWDFESLVAGKTLQFGANDTFHILSPTTWHVGGVLGNPMILERFGGNPGDRWNVNAVNPDVSHVIVKDSNNLNINIIDPANSIDGGNNLNWFAAPVVPPVVLPPLTPVTVPDPIDAQLTPQASMTAQDTDVSPESASEPSEQTFKSKNAANQSGIRAQNLYVADLDGIRVYNADRGEPMKVFTWNEPPSSLVRSGSGGQVYAVLPRAKMLLVIDTDTLEVRQKIEGLDEAPGDMVLSPDEGTAYVVSTATDTVQVVDFGQGKVVRSFETGSMPAQVTVTGDNQYLFVSNRLDKTVSKINTQTGLQEAVFGAGESPYGIALIHQDQELFVTDTANNRVLVIGTGIVPPKAEAEPEQEAIEMTATPKIASVSPESLPRNDDSTMVTSDVTHIEENQVQAPQGEPLQAPEPNSGEEATRQVKQSLEMSAEGDARAIEMPAGPRAYEIQSAIQVGTAPHEITVDPEGKTLYVSNRGSHSVSMIDMETKEVKAEIQVGERPAGIALSSDRSQLYVANERSGNISVINLKDQAVVSNIPAGFAPSHIVASLSK